MLIGSIASVRSKKAGRRSLAASSSTLGPEVLPALASPPWTVSGADATHIATFSGGTLRYQSDVSTPSMSVVASGVLTIGKTYELSITISARVSGAIKTDAFGSLDFGTTPSTYTYRAVATDTNFNIRRSGNGTDVTVSMVSAREVLG